MIKGPKTNERMRKNIYVRWPLIWDISDDINVLLITDNGWIVKSGNRVHIVIFLILIRMYDLLMNLMNESESFGEVHWWAAVTVAAAVISDNIIHWKFCIMHNMKMIRTVILLIPHVIMSSLLNLALNVRYFVPVTVRSF